MELDRFVEKVRNRLPRPPFRAPGSRDDTQPAGPSGIVGLRNYLALRRESLDFFTRLAREHGGTYRHVRAW